MEYDCKGNIVSASVELNATLHWEKYCINIYNYLIYRSDIQACNFRHLNVLYCTTAFIKGPRKKVEQNLCDKTLLDLTSFNPCVYLAVRYSAVTFCFPSIAEFHIISMFNIGHLSLNMFLLVRIPKGRYGCSVGTHSTSCKYLTVRLMFQIKFNSLLLLNFNCLHNFMLLYMFCQKLLDKIHRKLKMTAGYFNTCMYMRPDKRNIKIMCFYLR